MPSPFDDLYGLELLEASAEVMRGRIEVADHHKQPMGLVHGGVYASMAETLASIGTWLGVQEDGNTATGMSNSTTFLRPVTEGEGHRGRAPAASRADQVGVGPGVHRRARAARRRLADDDRGEACVELSWAAASRGSAARGGAP